MEDEKVCEFFMNNNCLIAENETIYTISVCSGDIKRCVRPNLRSFFKKWIIKGKRGKGFEKKVYKCLCKQHIFCFGTAKRGLAPLALVVYNDDCQKDGFIFSCMATKVAEALFDFQKAIKLDRDRLLEGVK